MSFILWFQRLPTGFIDEDANTAFEDDDANTSFTDESGVVG